MNNGSASTAPEKSDLRKRFLKDTFQLGSGTVLAQVITILSVPLLSRIYAPDAFGIAALFGSVVFILSTISGLRYELAILLPEDDHDGFNLALLQVGLTVVIGALTGLLLWVWRQPISRWLNSPELCRYLWAAGPVVIVLGVLNGLSYWHTRLRQFVFLAGTRLAGSIATAVGQLTAGLLGVASAGGLIAGTAFGRALEDFMQAWKGAVDARHRRHKLGGVGTLWRLAKRYRKFPMFTTGSALVSTLSWQVTPFLLAIFFAPAIVGFYSVGERVIRTPMNMLGRAISQVFFQQGAEARRSGDLSHVFLNTLQLLARIGLLPTAVLTIAGREIFIIVLGARWAEAGIYVQILGVWAYVWFLSSPTSIIMSIVEEQEKALLFNSINLATRIAALVIGGFLGQPRIAILLFSASGFITYGWLLIWIGQIAGVSRRKTLRATISADAVWVIPICGLLIVTKLIGGSYFLTVLLAAVMLLGYYGFLFRKFKHGIL